MQGKVKYTCNLTTNEWEMELYKRFKNALDEGMKMSELERRADSLRDRLYGYERLTDSSSSTARGAGFIFGSVAVQQLDELCQESNELRGIRINRVNGYYSRGLCELELFIENFGYVLGYKIENFRMAYRDLARNYDLWKYDRRKNRSIEKGESAHQFFENEAILHDKEKAKRLGIYEKEREKQRKRLNRKIYL